jgi:hypothetical protein
MERDRFLPTSFLNSYTPLLYRALQDTTGPIIECGMGNYSTALLHDTGRHVISYDTHPEWFNRFPVSPKVLISPTEWVTVTRSLKTLASVFFVDQAPGEIREKCIAELSTGFDGIVVAHDTEPAADYGYKMRQHFHKFRYIVEVKTSDAWATALSNTVDVTEWSGDTFGMYTIE